MNKTIHTAYGKIEYTLLRKNMKNMRLKIEDGRVVVSCAKSVQIKSIENFVVRHIQWIIETQKKLEKKKEGVLPGRYETGEIFHYLGQSFTLAILPAEKEKAVLNGETLLLCVRENTLEARKKLFLRWLFTKGKEIIEERYESLFPQFERKLKTKPKLTFRKMKSRWGSANIKKNRITLNTALIMAPVTCIDYVVVHELSHFIHANHSRDFYNEVAQHIPDWKDRRLHLNKQYSLDI